MRYFKRILICLSVALSIMACDNGLKESDVVNNNEFTLECKDARWADGIISFAPEGGSVILHIAHDVTSVAWQIRSVLDDFWCSYERDVDDLIIIALPNTDEKTRNTHFEVIIGENIIRVEVTQNFIVKPPHVSDPSELPDTDWSGDEESWI